MVLDKLSDKFNISIEKAKLNGLIGEIRLNGEKLLLVKPTTFMNLSGNCVSEVLNFYKVLPQDLIVVYDDIDIEVGKIRIKPSGSAGTHNGMRDISSKLGTNDFVRVRVGAGKPQNNQDLANFVLGGFRKEEIEEINKAIENASEAVLEVINNGVYSAMNRFN